MSALIVAAPLAVIAMGCLWLGWKGQFRLFVAWAMFWVLLTSLVSVYVFVGSSPIAVIATLAGGLGLFQMSIFGAGFLAKRARDHNANNV